MSTPESAKVLAECAEIQVKKSRDYQNPNSTVQQADYYPNGVQSIHDVRNGKRLRMKSVMEAMRGEDYEPNFESLQDSCIDMINYCSFFVAYMNHGIDGQDPNRDFLNRPIDKDKDNNE